MKKDWFWALECCDESDTVLVENGKALVFSSRDEARHYKQHSGIKCRPIKVEISDYKVD